MGRVRHRTGRESGVAGRDLELGSSAAFGTKDYRLGLVSPYHGRAVDLGIFLADSWAPSGIYLYRCLDSPCRVQFVKIFSVDLL